MPVEPFEIAMNATAKILSRDVVTKHSAYIFVSIKIHSRKQKKKQFYKRNTTFLNSLVILVSVLK